MEGGSKGLQGTRGLETLVGTVEDDRIMRNDINEGVFVRTDQESTQNGSTA